MGQGPRPPSSDAPSFTRALRSLRRDRSPPVPTRKRRSRTNRNGSSRSRTRKSCSRTATSRERRRSGRTPGPRGGRWSRSSVHGADASRRVGHRLQDGCVLPSAHDPRRQRRARIGHGGEGSHRELERRSRAAGSEHVYSVVLDTAGRPLTEGARSDAGSGGRGARDSARRGSGRAPVLGQVGARSGVRVRWIDEDGRIAGASVLVGGARPGNYYWPRDREGAGRFLRRVGGRSRSRRVGSFLRRLSRELEPMGVRAARDRLHVGLPGRGAPAVRRRQQQRPHVAYKLERDAKNHLIERMRLPLDSPQLANGLDETKRPPSRKDRELGEFSSSMRTRRSRTRLRSPAAAKGASSPGTTSSEGRSRLIDPVQGKVMWRKKFAEKGASARTAGSRPTSGARAHRRADARRSRRRRRRRCGVSSPSPPSPPGNRSGSSRGKTPRRRTRNLRRPGGLSWVVRASWYYWPIRSTEKSSFAGAPAFEIVMLTALVAVGVFGTVSLSEVTSSASSVKYGVMMGVTPFGKSDVFHVIVYSPGATFVTVNGKPPDTKK